MTLKDQEKGPSRMIIAGPQGSGKGTQASFIAKKRGLTHINTGAILRAEIRSNSELGKKIKDEVAGGNLVSDDLIEELIKKATEDHKAFIIDGFPRNRLQAEYARKNLSIDVVLLLEVPEEVSLERISGRRICSQCGKEYHIKYKPPKKEGICDFCGGKLEQRIDDKPEAVKKRLRIYREETEPPLKELFSDKIIMINGDQGIEEVRKEIEEKLKEKSF